MRQGTRIADRVLLVVALTTLALAVNHFLLHWVMFTGALQHRWLFGV